MPALHTVQLAKILYKLTDGVEADKVDAAVATFVQYLDEHRMLSKAPHVIAEFERISKEAEGAEDIQITSAVELSADVVMEIGKQLNAHKDAQIETTVDESLIGGVVARKGNTIFDASIKTELERIARSLN